MLQPDLELLNRKSCMHRAKNSISVKAIVSRVLLAFVLGSASVFALPLHNTAPNVAYADIRPDDVVNGQMIGLGNVGVPDAPSIEGRYAALCTRSNIVLWERNSTSRTPMASTTKIMTALVALEQSTPDTPMTVTYGAANTEGSSADLKEGDTALLRDLLVCMMVPSGNDASVAIAENIAGTERAFVDLMNAKAAAIGMTGTNYSNASGITDKDNYTTAMDYVLLTKAAMSNDLFREIVGSKEVAATVSGKEVVYESTNDLLSDMQGANGVKTGFTDAAGYCLVASAQRNGFELYAVVINSTSENQRFVDCEALLEWGFAHYRNVELPNL